MIAQPLLDLGPFLNSIERLPVCWNSAISAKFIWILKFCIVLSSALEKGRLKIL